MTVCVLRLFPQEPWVGLRSVIVGLIGHICFPFSNDEPGICKVPKMILNKSKPNEVCKLMSELFI